MKRSSTFLTLTLAAAIAMTATALPSAAAESAPVTEPSAYTAPAEYAAQTDKQYGASGATTSDSTHAQPPRGVPEAVKKRIERRTALRWC